MYGARRSGSTLDFVGIVTSLIFFLILGVACSHDNELVDFLLKFGLVLFHWSFD
jgi:hypothetical protein